MQLKDNILFGDFMRLYSYVVVSDTGFAPNPFDNFCTLATCKPRIRKNAKIGDIIIGTGSKSNVGNDKLIYAMKITERMNYNDYFNDNRFIGRSDNIYYLDNNSWKQKKPIIMKVKKILNVT